MGADIHWDVEVRDGEGWRRIEADEALAAAGITLEDIQKRLFDGKWKSNWLWYRPNNLAWPRPRDYVLFGALADVRHDVFFKSTGIRQLCIKGVPKDWSGEMPDSPLSDPRPYIGDHSYCWTMLSSLLPQLSIPFTYTHHLGEIEEWTLERWMNQELREMFFEVLPKVADPKDIRIIMGFDS